MNPVQVSVHVYLQLDRRVICRTACCLRNNANKPELFKIERINECFHVTIKMDRLFRSLSGTLNQLEEWANAGVLFECIDQPLLSTSDASPTGDLMRQMLLAFAQFERSLIATRTAEGRARAIANGKKMGRKRKLKPKKIEKAAERVAKGESIKEVADDYGVDRTTMWRRLRVLDAGAASAIPAG